MVTQLCKLAVSSLASRAPNSATKLVYSDRVCAVAYLQGFGVYRFAKKYGANVDGYSPIYQPDYWSESGNEYKFGSKGLLAWYATVYCVRV